MRWAEFEELAADLDCVHLTTPKGLRLWRLYGRLIARQLESHSVAVRTGFNERQTLLDKHPDIFRVPTQFRAHMMVVADLRTASPIVIRPALEAAWTLQSQP
jgi:hypothetical protein